MSQTKAQLIEGSAASELTAAKTLLGAGSAGAPSLTAIGDTNTGIFFPTADTIAFAEGGAEAVRIDSSGRVGIGTSSVSNKLHLSTTGTDGFRLAVDGQTYYHMIRPNGDGLYFGADDGNTGGAGADIRFNIKATERMRLTTTGLGIGTTSPSTELHISRATAGRVITRLADPDGRTTELRSPDNVGNTAGVGTTTNHPFVFFQNNTEAARIDEGKRLLVGTSTSALEKLVIKADGGGIQINRNDSGSPTSNQSLGSIGFKGIVSANSNAAAEVLIQASADENHSALAAGSRLEFYTKPNGTGPGSAPTERMRIKADGTVLMNNTSGSVGDIGFQFTAAGVSFDSVAASTSATNTLHVYSTTASAYRFYVGMDGTVNATNTTISAISDQRFKENIRDLDVGLNQILALQPRRFDWKPGKGKDIQNDQGFIAQEFEQVFPEMIGEWLDPAPEGEEPYKSVRADLIPVLVKAIQEQQAIINGLEARLTALETN